MKFLCLFLAIPMLLLPACETAHDAASGAGHVAGHAIAKTGSAVAHGGEKLEHATQ